MAAPCVALLPGLDGTGDLFRPLLDVIPPWVNTRVISYPADTSHSYSELLGLIEARLRDEPDVVLVAESFSGPLALRYAAAWPGRVRGVVLCASFVRPPLPRWVLWFCRAAVFRMAPPAFLVRRLMVGGGASAALVKAVRDAVRQVRPRVLAGRLREAVETDAVTALRDCSAPILYLAARGDALVGASAVRAIRAVRDDVRFVELDGPHLLLQREPGAAWREVERFLAAIGLAPAQRARATGAAG